MTIPIPGKYLDWIVPIVLACLTALGAVYNAKADLEKRVTTLETHRVDEDAKVDHIGSQVDKLVEWALGHK